MSPVLTPAPTSISDPDGRPLYGTYQGALGAIGLGSLKGEHQLGFSARVARQKRWIYTFVATPEVIALYSIADLSYTANAFALVVDLKDKKVLVDETFLVPPGPHATVGDRPSQGLAAHFFGLPAQLAATRPEGDDRFHQTVRLGRLRPFPSLALSWKGALLAAGGPPPLTAIAPVEGGGVNVTQKWAGLLAFGSLEAGGRRYLLDGGVGGMDYTQGYLARHTAWRWAFACGRLDDGTPLGVNLVEGFNEGGPANENAVWIGGALYPVGRAHFTYQRGDVLEPWAISTDDGAVHLTMKPIAVHRDDRDLKLVKSHFAQPVGLFEGTVRVGGQTYEVRGVPGVTEDQDILW